MLKKLIKHFTIGIKEEVKEADLKNKPLQYLLIAKEDEHDYYVSKLPIFFAGLGIVVSVYIAVQNKYNAGQATNPILAIIFPLVALFFIARLGKLLSDLEKNNRITDNNLKVYDKVIENKIKKEEKAKKEYKDKKIALLEEIRDNTKSKTKQ